MTYTNFQIFLKISLVVMVEIVDLALRAAIDSFEIDTVNSLNKKKSSRLILLCPKLYLGSPTKIKQLLLLLLLNEVVGHVNHVFDRISSFIHKPLFQNFHFCDDFFFFLTSVEILNKGSCLKENILLKKWFTWPRTSLNNESNHVNCDTKFSWKTRIQK